MIALDLQASGQKLAAHGCNRRVADEIGHCVDRMDVSVHQAGTGVVNHGPDLADLAGGDRVFDHLVAVVKAAQDACVEERVVALYGIADFVGALHRAGHGLFEEDHRHAQIGHRHR